MENIDVLTNQIFEAHKYFKSFALRQINYAITLRNWVIGYYLVEYEQGGKDRAIYGEKTLQVLSARLQKTGAKGFSDRNLRLCRQFYQEYPKIWQFLTSKFQQFDNQPNGIWQLLTAKLEKESETEHSKTESVPVAVLLDKLSFTHFIELLKIDTPIKRTFFELQTIKNNWTVEQLKSNIDSMLYERIGLSRNKVEIFSKLTSDNYLQTSDVIKNPYILDFLGIDEKPDFSETDLEQAIINELQKFLVELGRGFCFEARQKRITINNRHDRIDLVFYHRILKCHVLIDLKIGEFEHSDAGQMNFYLNYYKENEMTSGDNPPVGIILCSQKDETMVHYATGGLSHEIFVSKYMLQLPGEAELKKIIQMEIMNYQG